MYIALSPDSVSTNLAFLFPSSNMPWPEGVIEQFEIVDLDTTEESDFYGPFNSLLVELFPSSEHYQVSPQFKCRIDGSLDFTNQFTVHRCRIPVFFLEVSAAMVQFSPVLHNFL
jgi:hypothetical protein